VSNFIVQALNGEPLTIYGDGHQSRSFCYVDDLIEGCIRLMNAPDELIGPVNIGNPRESTVREVAELTLALTNSSSELVKRPLPTDDPVRRCPDISVARDRLGWVPTVPLEEGLAKTVAYFRKFVAPTK